MRLGEMQSMIASHICNIVAWKRVYLLAVSSPDVFELYLHLRYVDFISYIFVLHLYQSALQQQQAGVNEV